MGTFYFTWFDYTIFCSILVCSVLIGIYFGCREKKIKNNDYLLGGKTNIIPVAASLVASNITGITLIGMPSEIYKYGAMYIWSPISKIIAVLTTMYITMPVLLSIGSSSIFEYLELRFNKKIRILASIFSIIQMNLMNPLIIYVPSIVLAQFTGFSITVLSIVGCVICICYTTIGGLNAVIWADTLQTVIVFTSLIVVLIIGLISGGGITAVWTESVRGERLDVLRCTIDATDRDSIWIIILGYSCVGFHTTAINQGTLQRLMSVKSNIRAKKTLCLYLMGSITFCMFIVVLGLGMYARYSKCDPYYDNKIENHDQIVAYYVTDVGGHIFGLPGLFISGLYCTGLSTLSTNLNSSAAIIYTDVLLPIIPAEWSRKHRNSILKLIVMCVGVLCVILSCFVQYFGEIISLANCIGGICGAPLFGIYILGMVYPKANSKGALVGSIIASAFMIWLTIGNHYYRQNGSISDIIKPMSIENCNSTSNVTDLLESSVVVTEEPFVLYRVVHWYYLPISICLALVFGFLVSLITYKKTHTVRAELITPLFRFLLQSSKSQNSQCTNVGKFVDHAMSEL